MLAIDVLPDSLRQASSDSTARVWDVENGESMLELKGHQRAVTSVALRD